LDGMNFNYNPSSSSGLSSPRYTLVVNTVSRLQLLRLVASLGLADGHPSVSRSGVNGRLSSLLDFLPLMLYHLLVPPMSYLEGWETHFEYPPGSGSIHAFRYLYRALPLPPQLQDVHFVRDLAHFRSVRADGGAQESPAAKVSKLLLQSLVHDSFTHVAEHMSKAWLYGATVHQRIGAEGMYSVFLAGGAAAALPALLQSLGGGDRGSGGFASGGQYLRSIAQELPSVTLNMGLGLVGTGVGQKWQLPGSAGGLGALLGCSAVFLADETLELLQLCLPAPAPTAAVVAAHVEQRSERSRRRVRLLLASLDLAMAVVPVLHGLLMLAADAGLGLDYSAHNSGSGSGSGDDVGHVAQVRGLAVGAAWGLFSLLKGPVGPWGSTGSGADWAGESRRVGSRLSVL